MVTTALKGLEIPGMYGDKSRTVAMRAGDVNRERGQYWNLDIDILGCDGDGKVTNLIDSPYYHLSITCQGRDDDHDKDAYSFRVVYRDVYTVTLDRAESMAGMLRKVKKGLAKLHDLEGDCLSMGQYALRVARVLGIAHYLTISPGQDWGYGMGALHPIKDVQYHVDARIRQAFAEP